MAEGILARIASAKRDELERRFDGVSIEALRAAAEPSRRSLAAALGREGARFILEIKKASPSAGAIRLEADVPTLARGYSGVADALSVLCDAAHFGGSLDDLAAARRSYDGPILAKDFFIDLRQVAEARLVGADAILVMLSLVDDETARAMVEEARLFSMDVLVEVHSEGEMRRALALGAPLIGINNRDLGNFSVDLAVTERLAGLAPDRLLVSESGISSRADVERIAPLVDGFLIGSALMRSADPAQAARKLVFGRTKLCGLKCGADLRAARPAAHAGFVFVPGSPRHVTADEAAPLAGIARRSGILPVGVFRDASMATVADIATLINLHAVQLHGSEGPGYVRALRRELPPSCEIWTAMSVGREALDGRGGDRILFDNEKGGSGANFDWSLVKDHPELARGIVAGGIGAHNAVAARGLGAFAIDIGSSVDLKPGLKSAERIAALFEALRPRSRQRLRECA
ncbi:MAG TPA: bifunctional indole-3-glycerol-phosphate synthase TrpC/phosphoribosylanthranilate isomerase TrpF [Sphingomicrobium sp.]|jgi:indole-3-glycerol phosphate synthase/phosphoribosylanthranilate isomerase|nr:bifunctional indole-3-glycerol-phosphate synthase TrpC/phosphoribosylanthranilate isomerase TrpF [Sphingomicrobium sp.]